ncbi:MAG: hypothetical protein DSZ06_00930 [Sulfurospirillum sp.]|nr:MAG: hypothetical protein DSZ06_00930 [Sulfurospirillum sp.]
MKIISRMAVSVVALAILASNASAGWMVVNEDGTKVPYTADCCHVVKKIKKSKKYCKTCDYSAFPEAETLPLESGEYLPPAKLGFCGKNK